jgi:hypothetical protein
VWKNTFFFTDRNGVEAETNVYLAAPDSFPELDGAVSAIGDVLGALSTALLLRAESRLKYVPVTPQVVKGPASSYDRLIVLCTDGVNYASITIPAPSPQPYLLQGPFRGFKVDKSVPGAVLAIQELVNLLGNTVTPHGTPFPTLDWQAALMVPQL